MIQRIKQFFAPLATRLHLLFLVMVSGLAAAAGPFGTYEKQSFLLRLLYWFLVVASSIIAGHLSRTWAHRLVPAEKPVRTDLTMVGFMVLLFTPILWGLTHGLLNTNPQGGPSAVKLSYYVAVVTLAICVARRILPGFEPVGYFGSDLPDELPRPRLYRRLPPDFEGPVLRLAVRDHIVDVVSESGTESIRLRFADAIDEMDTMVGYVTHRSHWVARDAIAGVMRVGGKMQIRLTNGDLVPVSRKFRPDLEQAGVI